MRDASPASVVSLGALLLFFAVPALPRDVTVRIDRGRVERMPLDRYVAAVVAGEAAGLPKEARRAMAVAARTFAVKFAGRHQVEGFDFCDTTHCQDYRGVAVTEVSADAAFATEGELVWYRGRPAATYYSHDCGGRTEAAGAVWPDQAAPYLVSLDDPWCPRAPWTAAIARADLRRAAGAETAAIAARTGSGRVAQVRIGGQVVSGRDFRFAVGRTLGWNLIRGDLWSMREAGARVIFEGRGHGHGVGLCQEGAARMASAGKTHREILAHYYPGTVTGIGASGFAWKVEAGERVELWTAGRNDRRWLALADAAAAQATERAGFGFARRVRVRIFPDAATFRDATGEPGWIDASTRGGTVRLHAASATSATLRHEMAHALVESRATPRAPLWLREGAARWIAGERSTAAAGRPADAEFTNPQSRQAMQSAYDRALAEVESMIRRSGPAALRGWIERGL